MNHLHTYLKFEAEGSLNILLDNPANVYLMEDKEYENYLEGKEFRSIGGWVKTASRKMKAPAPGHWHLVVDDNSTGRDVNISLQLTNGEVVPYMAPRSGELAEEKEPGPALKPRAREELKKKLVKELTKMIKDIDLEGLQFLHRQGSVLLHNQKVDEINKEIEEHNKKQKGVRKGAPESKKTAKTSAEKRSPGIDLLENNENSFILVFKGTRKILSRQELRQVLKLCHEPLEDEEFSRRFYHWLKTRRNDILFDSQTRHAGDPALVTLRKFLVKRYKPRE